MPKTIAIIPARSGSKRLPGKNIRNFDGKPLLAWSVEAAVKSQLFDSVIIDSDDEEIIAIAESYGAKSLYKRPLRLSMDATPTSSVVTYLLSHVPSAETIMLLQPTSPLRTAQHLLACMEQFDTFSMTSIVSVSRRDWNRPLFYFMSKSGKLFKKRTSKSDVRVYLNGAIYLFKADWFSVKQKFVTRGTCGFLMPDNFSIDIDTLDDWKNALRLKKILRNFK